MLALVDFLYWFHWGFTASLAVSFINLLAARRPWLLSRLLVAGFLLSQVLYNGCLLTTLQSWVRVEAGLSPLHNHFLMTNIASGGWLVFYKVLFTIVGAWQMLIIVKTMQDNNNEQPKLYMV